MNNIRILKTPNHMENHTNLTNCREELVSQTFSFVSALD